MESYLDDDNNDEPIRYRWDPKYSSERYLIFPDDPLKIAWDFLIGICLVYTCFVLPYTISFIEPGDTFDKYYFIFLKSSEDQIIGRVIDGLFMIDILSIFITAYIDNDDNLIVNKKQIALNYLTGWFIFDFIGVFPFDLILEQETRLNNLVRISRLPRIYKIVKIVKLSRIMKLLYQRKKYVELIHDFSNISANIRLLILSSLSIIIFSHVCACMWYFIGKENKDSGSWVSENDLLDQPTFARFSKFN